MHGTRIGVFTREYVPTGGHCPVCSAVMDNGCRIVAAGVLRIDPAAPGLEHDGLRALLLAHPFMMEVECCDPRHLAEQRAWDEEQARSRS